MPIIKKVSKNKLVKDISKGESATPTINYLESKIENQKDFNQQTYLEKNDFANRYNSIKKRFDQSEKKLLELNMENAYMKQKQSMSSDHMLELFLNETQTDNPVNPSQPLAEVMDDNQWDNNWKEHPGTGSFKNGFIRPRKQHYMLEQMEIYDLEGVGQFDVRGISSYDSVNDCYWITSTSQEYNVSAGIAEITKISKNFKDGKIEVLGRWYFDNPDSTHAIMSIDCSPNGDFIYFHVSNSIYKVSINSDGTLGKNNIKNGQVLDYSSEINYIHSETNENVDTLTYWQETGFEDYIAFIAHNTSTHETTIRFLKASDDGATFNTPDKKNIIGFLPFIGENGNWGGRALKKQDNTLWIAANIGLDGTYHIHKINLSEDIVLGTTEDKITKTSGRFAKSRELPRKGTEGITISHDGHILEVVNPLDKPAFIAKRALKNALWAENQVKDVVSITDIGSNYRGIVWDDEDPDIFWYSANNGTENTVRIYKRNIKTGDEAYATITGGFNIIFEFCFAEVNNVNYIYITAQSSAGDHARVLEKSVLNSALSESGGTLDLSATGVSFSGYSATISEGITTDNQYIYIANDVTDSIEQWSMGGNADHSPIEAGYEPTLINSDYIQLKPASKSYYRSLKYYKNNFYIVDSLSSNGKSYIYQLETTPNSFSNNSYTWKRLHIYQDPSSLNIFGCFHFDMKDDKIWWMEYSNPIIQSTKILEDPDTIQLHTFMDSNNILLSDNISHATPIIERYFEPEDFKDPRDIPDKNYMAVGYSDSGFSLLHLDNFLNEKTSSGLDRYDVSKIRVQHYKAVNGENNLIPEKQCAGLFIEKDIIFYGRNSANSYYGALLVINLKNGKSMMCAFPGSSGRGQYYNGSLSERNDNKGYEGVTNENFTISTSATSGIRKIHVRTFSKEDLSDYQGANPKTFVAIGTGGGCDILLVDWDENNNRTPVKVWKNIFNGVYTGRFANYIAPSGLLFAGLWGATGEIYTLPSEMKIWEINKENIGNFKVGQTNGYMRDIAPNSSCWKTPSGTWRHQLIYGTYDNYADQGTSVVGILDIESETNEIVWYKNVNTESDNFNQVDCFEDKIFSLRTDTTTSNDITGYYSGINIHSKNNFKTNYVHPLLNGVFDQNNWDTDYIITSKSSPMFAPSCTHTIGESAWPSVRYSSENNVLMIGTETQGLQLFHFPQMNNCQHYSKQFELNKNPEKVHYIQNALLPEGEKLNILDKQNNSITYTGNWKNLSEVQNITLEEVENFENGIGTFGSPARALKKTDGSNIQEGIDYNYDERLDDESEGVNIYDTGTSGDLESDKYLRIVENGKNITDSTGLSLEVIARDLTFNQNPFSNQVYVDPANGKFILPRPAYWHKCDSGNNSGFNNPEIDIYQSIYTENDDTFEEVVIPSKFGNGYRIRPTNIGSSSFAQLTLKDAVSGGIGRKGTLAFWYKIDPNYTWGSHVWVGSAWYDCMLELMLYDLRATRRMAIKSEENHIAEINSGFSFIGNDYKLVYLVWDMDQFSDGKTIKVYIDNTLMLSTNYVYSNSILSMPLIMHFGHSPGGDYRQDVDNIMYWDEMVSETPDWLYNNGTGIEDALHPIYGSTNDYKPLLTGTQNGVGYFYTPESSDPAELDEDAGAFEEIQSEVASNMQYGSGTFGVSATIAKGDNSVITEGVDFEYDKALDNSDGAGYNIYDVKDSGLIGRTTGDADTATEYFRVLNDTVNIVDDTNLNLTPIAKDLSFELTSPPADQLYIDPSNGKFVLPRPIYYADCADEASLKQDAQIKMRNLEVVNNDTTISSLPFIYEKGIRVMAPIGKNYTIFPLGQTKGSRRGVVSLWFRLTSETHQRFINIGFDSTLQDRIQIFRSNSTGSCQIWTNNNNTAVTGLDFSGIRHAYIAWDVDGGLQGGKTIRVFINGVEVNSTNQTFRTDGLYIRAHNSSTSTAASIIDLANIKAWDQVISETPNWLFDDNTTKENALHPIYASTNYEPLSINVGYFKATTAGHNLQWKIPAGIESAKIHFKTGEDCGNAKIKVFSKKIDETERTFVKEEIVDLYRTAGSLETDYAFPVKLQNLPDTENIIEVYHANEHHLNAIAPYSIKVAKFITVEKLISSQCQAKLITRYGTVGEQNIFDLVPGASTNLYLEQKFSGDGKEDSFNVNVDAFELFQVSIDAGDAWINPEMGTFTYGNNFPECDNLMVENSFGIKFKDIPSAGENNIIVRYIPKIDRYKVETTIKMPEKDGWVDLTKNPRLLDYGIEFI